jgi:sugar phosphate isomerase/epimerase
MDRRSFVGALGAVGAASLLPLGNELFAQEKISRIGVQLYTVRDLMKVSVEKTLAQVADIGFKEVEFAGYFNRPPRAIRQLLDRNGMTSPAAHLGMREIRGSWNRTLNDAAEIGHKYLVVASLDGADSNSVDAIKRTADIMRKAAEDAKMYKIKLAYHNHESEFRLVDGKRSMFDVLLEETSPETLEIEMDLYWITKGGGDPLAHFKKYPGRFPMVHVKDAGPPPGYQMMDVGKGTIKWAEIFAQHKEAGIKHYFVEHDSPADQMASIKTSYEYLNKLRF